MKTTFLCLLVVLTCTLPVSAQVPSLIAYQGCLTDAFGDPVADDSYSVQFALFDAFDAPTSVWTETKSIQTTNCVFETRLGSATPIALLPFDKPLWLGIKVGSDPPMTPRMRLVSAPYALSLRGMIPVPVTDETTSSINLIGGASENSVGESVIGATISGGGGVSGGFDVPNEVLSNWGAIGGGANNTVSGAAGTVAGGDSNTAGMTAAVGGGSSNVATGLGSTIPGGVRNEAPGSHAMAFGNFARALNDGSLVWQDETGWEEVSYLESSADNQFLARASGGITFITSSAAETTDIGAELPAGSGSWTALSSRDAKTDFEAVDVSEVLAKVSALGIEEWRYIAEDQSIRHIGPMAQDFYEAFGLGRDEEHIATIDASGVALAAIKGLYGLVLEQNERIEALEDRLAALDH